MVVSMLLKRIPISQQVILAMMLESLFMKLLAPRLVAVAQRLRVDS